MSAPIEIALPGEPVIGGLAFPECPRWHQGAWWFSDMHAQRVYRIDTNGRLSTVIELDDRPAGLSFQGDRMFVVGMTKQELLSIEDGRIVKCISLRDHAPFHCNDMVMDQAGRAYIGNFGFDFEAHEAPRPTHLLRVDADDSIHVVAGDLLFPNGMVLSDDGKSLTVAESYGNCLTSFTVTADGELGDRKSFARFDKRTPDGIGLDQEGAIWMASPPTREVLRVTPGGAVTHLIRTSVHALACMLGGASGRTLLICSAPLARPDKTVAARAGRIDMVEVEIGHAGRP
jgi:sugar lactone lactonase YvrE